ncbi:probable E3 ubiquitin-protein ligase HERC4 [Periophthalmus magnuspinnatus]|uniref:probable E3 ubiquitin-protein ligase HERC4 n=1 Tax=Periophthalmus magnuspinnatus TaxID=409849 RepID=UPI00145BB2DE|nr:probable E3 ubiquitin-protein ligase HERC4 [Periophthalmus magnuspinnatus]
MFAWGEQSARGFRLKDGSYVPHSGDTDTVGFLDLPCPVTNLCVGSRLLAYVNRDGKAYIIHLNLSADGKWVRGKQKHVESKEKIRAVSCTKDTLFLLSNQGQVLCVQPGVPPRPFEPFRGVPVCQVSCGSQHSLALTKDGEVFSWGVDSRGQLGVGKSEPGVCRPQPVRSVQDLPVVLVAAGGEQSFCLTVSGGVWSWGHNCNGQLGLGDTTDRHTPALVHSLTMKKTCHISCGEGHTAVLTKDGAVYTFGSGEHGQLGHNSFKDELRPRLVAELWGSKVTAVACGRLHTVVLADCRVYSCGVQGAGPGAVPQDSAAVPLLVQLPYELTEGRSIRWVFAGGHCSYAACFLQEREHQSDGMSPPPLSDLLTKWTSNTQSWKKTKREIDQTFSSVSRLNQSFLEHRPFETSSKGCGLDLSAAHRSFSKLLKQPSVMEKVESACERLVLSLNPCPLGVECLRVYLLLTDLLHVLHVFHQLSRTDKPHKESALLEALAKAILRLPEESIRVLGEWWSALPTSIRLRHVCVWRDAAPHVSSLSISRSVLQILQHMYNRNKALGEDRLPDSAFCLQVPFDFVVDMVVWKQEPTFRMGEMPILCSFPFLMDLQTRHHALNLNNKYLMVKSSMEMTCAEENLEMLFPGLFSGLFPGLYPHHFTLRLRRERAMEDTFTQLSLAEHMDFRKPLLVYFNEVDIEDNVNQKDFFHLVFHEVVSAESGMFMFNDSATLAWFSSTATPPLEHYFLFGELCGLALYHLHAVFLPFPLALFKKLLGVSPSLDDLCQLSPCTGQSLRCLLEEYSDDVIQTLDMDFTIHWDQKKVPLDPHSPDRPVNAHNKEEFVAAFIEHVFTRSVQRQFQEFRRGFYKTADRHMVELFSPEELRDLMVGQECTDWTKLKKSAMYEGIYEKDGEKHPTIQMFWEVFDELTEKERNALLWFITGFERLPILRVDLKIKFQGLPQQEERLSEDQYFPQSHTCFTALELPQYSSKELMKMRLSEALAQFQHRHDQTVSDTTADILLYD